MPETGERISWEATKNRLEERLKPVAGDLQKINAVISEHLEYLRINYNQLTPEAQKATDKMFHDFSESLCKAVEEVLPRLPDSVHSRKMKRSVLGVKGKRLVAQPHMEIFDKPISNPTPIQLKVREIFEHELQIIMDLYQDLMPRTFNGPAQFNQLSLLGACIDELLVAFSLSQRSYTGQAMSHLRTIQEALDLTRLFKEQPQWAELWNSDKPWWEVWNKLSPSKVKKLIKGGDKCKEIYESLSTLGTHPTFSMMRLRCKMRKDDRGKGRPQVDIKIGGTPKAKENMTVHMLLLLSLSMVLGELAVCFGKHLNEEEVSETLVIFMENFIKVCTAFILKPLSEGGVAEAKDFETKIAETFEEMKRRLNHK